MPLDDGVTMLQAVDCDECVRSLGPNHDVSARYSSIPGVTRKVIKILKKSEENYSSYYFFSDFRGFLESGHPENEKSVLLKIGYRYINICCKEI